MANSIRTEAIKSLDEELVATGKITQQKGISGLSTAIDKLNVAQTSFEEAMFDAIKLIYPRFYRTVLYGSARLEKDDADYKFAWDLANGLVEEIKDMDISSGGGPGVMTAAHEGALEARKTLASRGIVSRSMNWGILIRSLNFEEKRSPHDKASEHRDFPTRLMDFTNFSHSGIYLPGGYGTNYELTHGMQLKQVGHLDDNYPLIVHTFWKPVIDSLYEITYHQRNRDKQTHLISEKDLDLVVITDNIPTMVSIVSKSHEIWKEKYNDKLIRLPNGDNTPNLGK